MGYFCARPGIKGIIRDCCLHLKLVQLKKVMVQKTYFKTKDYCKVKFSFKNEEAEKIAILGLNSNWSESVIMSRKKDGSFTADVNLPKNSTHEFKYLVNETIWLNEPEADSELPNEFGGTNSVITL